MKFCNSCEQYDDGSCKLKGFKVSVNATFCKDYEEIVEYLFDVDRSDLYIHDKPEIKDRTRNRLIEISESGMTEVMIAQFGFQDVTSGLYIEYVWNYSDAKFDSFMSWVKGRIIKHLLSETKDK